MKRGDKVIVPERMGGTRGEIIEVRKFLGCPYLVRFEDGGRRWVGPTDIRRAAQDDR
jgi:hypothetical protein